MNQQEVNAAFYAAQSGDNDAFTKIFDAFWDMAYYNCLKRLRNTHDAEDAVQEVFIILYRRIARMKGPEYLAKGIQYYALEVCSKYYSKTKQVPSDMITPLDELHSDPPAPKEEFLPEVVLEREELKTEILQLVNKLPNRQREVLFNYYFNDFSAAEIAKMLNISVNAVGNCLHKARKKLSELVEKRTDSKELLLSSSVPIITTLFFEEMARVTVPAVKQRVTTSLAHRLIAEKALQSQMAHRLAQGTKQIVKTAKVISKAKVGAVTVAACAGIVVGVNKLNDTVKVPPVTPPQISQDVVIQTPPPAEPISFEVPLGTLTIKYFLETDDDFGYMGEDTDQVFSDLPLDEVFEVSDEIRDMHLPEGYLFDSMFAYIDDGEYDDADYDGDYGDNVDNADDNDYNDIEVPDGDIEAQDSEIRIIYARRQDLTVTVKYYIDSINNAGYMGSSYDQTIGSLTYGSTYTIPNALRNRNVPDGYVFDRVDTGGSLLVSLGSNEMRVLYSKRSDLAVTIKYYMDSVDESGYMGSAYDDVIGGLTYGSVYSLSDASRDRHVPTGYVYDSCNTPAGGLEVALGENEICILYAKRSDLSVTLKYYLDTMNDSGYMGSGFDETISNMNYSAQYVVPPELRDRYLPEGYRFASMDASGGSVFVSLGSNEVKILYTRREDFSVTIKYYKDSIDNAGYMGASYDQTIGGLSYGSTYSLDVSMRDLFKPDGYRYSGTSGAVSSVVVGDGGNVLSVLYINIGDLDTARVSGFSNNLHEGDEDNIRFTVHITLADGRSFSVDHVERVDERSKGNRFFLYNNEYGAYTVYAAWDDDGAVTTCEIREFVPVF